jgi:hypothetical protein
MAARMDSEGYGPLARIEFDQSAVKGGILRIAPILDLQFVIYGRGASNRTANLRPGFEASAFNLSENEPVGPAAQSTVISSTDTRGFVVRHGNRRSLLQGTTLLLALSIENNWPAEVFGTPRYHISQCRGRNLTGSALARGASSSVMAASTRSEPEL